MKYYYEQMDKAQNLALRDFDRIVNDSSIDLDLDIDEDFLDFDIE